MHQMVKFVFLTLLGAVVAVTLYWVFFGQDSSGWKGVLFYMADAIERPISNYYYDYVYLPSIHCNDSIDLSLGCTVTTGSPGDVFAHMVDGTDTDLSNSANDHIILPTSSYSTGWR